MLDRIRAFFVADEADPSGDPAALHLAAAALLIEVAKADQCLDQIELERLHDALARDWGLSGHDLADLVAAARNASDSSVSLHEYIDLINRRFSRQRKTDLVRSLWEVACADQQIHHYEEALIRRLADLLYVSHTDFIRTKHQVLDAPRNP